MATATTNHRNRLGESDSINERRFRRAHIRARTTPPDTGYAETHPTEAPSEDQEDLREESDEQVQREGVQQDEQAQPQEGGAFSPWQRHQEMKRMRQQEETPENSANFDGQKAQLDPGVLDTAGAAELRGKTQAMEEAEAIEKPIREEKERQLAEEQQRLREVAQNSWRAPGSSLREKALAANNLEAVNAARVKAAGQGAAGAARGAAATARKAAAMARGLVWLFTTPAGWITLAVTGIIMFLFFIYLVLIPGITDYVCNSNKKNLKENVASFAAAVLGNIECPSKGSATQTEAQRIQEESGPSAADFRGPEN